MAAAVDSQLSLTQIRQCGNRLSVAVGIDTDGRAFLRRAQIDVDIVTGVGNSVAVDGFWFYLPLAQQFLRHQSIGPRVRVHHTLASSVTKICGYWKQSKSNNGFRLIGEVVVV